MNAPNLELEYILKLSNRRMGKIQRRYMRFIGLKKKEMTNTLDYFTVYSIQLSTRLTISDITSFLYKLVNNSISCSLL